jgi:patatin-like phospholipase/acyl hydrolase
MQEIEREREIGATETPLPCQYFDLIGGTGTGGLIAIMLGRLGMVRPSQMF